jgi:hypothetical protein
MYRCHLPGNFLIDAADQSFGIVYTDSRTPLCKSSLLGNQQPCSGSHIYIRKSSSDTKIGHGKCWCCMTMHTPYQPSNNTDDLHSSVHKLLHTILKDWFAASIRKLLERWQWCTDLSGEYVECVEV